ncbi:MAG TPA: GMC family oxidoreductase N-terminal domain-containing protein [Steroidobacteraceae bacterium]|jgi:choline dehydrogenase
MAKPAKAFDCDYLVIGGGTAGCVIAARLSESKENRVILLEAGNWDSHPLLSIPGATPITSSASRFNWRVYTRPEPELHGRELFISQGKVMGGSSSINGMVYTRGQPWDYDHWSELGCRGWSSEDVLPVFRKSESNDRGPSHWHGGAGPVRVTQGRSELAICEEFFHAASAAGYAFVDDFAAERREGFGYFDTTVHHGRRSSSSQAFIHPAEHRKNLRIITGALARRLIFGNYRAQACEFTRRKGEERINVDREIVLCSGALRSPQLLMLSGIGPADHLHALGLKTIQELPGVGANLQNHLAYKLQYAVNRPITGYSYLKPARALRTGLEYAMFRAGYLAHSPTCMGGFLRTQRSVADAPDIQVFVNPALVGKIDQGLLNLLPKQHGFSVFVNQGRPWSRGEVRLRSRDAADNPLIHGRYLSDPRDLDVLTDGVEMMRTLILQGKLKAIIERELLPGPAACDRKALEDHIRRTCTNHFHLAGTCRMGEDPGAVVDSELRVRGLENVRVADASIMPTLINGNPMAPIMMIAEKAAEYLTQARTRTRNVY